LPFAFAKAIVPRAQERLQAKVNDFVKNDDKTIASQVFA
jgi:hypothetical protein